MNTKVMFSSNHDEWATPDDFFNQLNKEFNFTLDPCCTKQNHKCDKYFTLEDDGLSQDWSGETVFCNPPYSQIAQWVKKAWKEGTIVVLLIPARTDTKYFHNYIYNRSEIRFVKGRLKFGNCKNAAPFPSMIVVFRGVNER